RVIITDNRGTVPFLCAPCPIQGDTIVFTETPNPYTVTGCVDDPANLAQFEVVSPATAKIKWYTDATGGSPLNPVGDSSTIWTTDFANTNTSIPGCSRALFAEDVASFAGTLRPGTTVASAPCSGAGSAETGQRSPLKIEVTQDLTLTGLNIIIP